jgi:type VI secretion system protein ImpK
MTSTAGPSVSARPDNLALLFQECLTAIVRLRSNRQQLTDAESFRYHMREALKSAAQEAKNRAGYTGDDIRMATLAVAGFLDESVLNTRNPLFADWPRKPLQEELFGIHMAGEVFFQNLQQLLGRQDSADLADLLEVYYLCLLLGYTGRYSGSRGGELQSIMAATADKIRRIRGDSGPLSPAWAPQGEVVQVAKDRWLRTLLIAAVACFVLTLILFISFKLSLGSGANNLTVNVGQAPGLLRAPSPPIIPNGVGQPERPPQTEGLPHGISA